MRLIIISGRSGSGKSTALNQLEDESSQLSRIWNEQHDREVIASLLSVVRPRFQEKTWQAFHRQMFDGQRPAQIAAELEMEGRLVDDVIDDLLMRVAAPRA